MSSCRYVNVCTFNEWPSNPSIHFFTQYIIFEAKRLFNWIHFSFQKGIWYGKSLFYFGLVLEFNFVHCSTYLGSWSILPSHFYERLISIKFSNDCFAFSCFISFLPATKKAQICWYHGNWRHLSMLLLLKM